MIYFIKQLLVAMIVIIFTACGGGSNDNNFSVTPNNEETTPQSNTNSKNFTPIIAEFDSPSSAYKIKLSKDEKIAYITDGYKNLKIIDISDYKNFKIIGEIDINHAKGLAISEDEKIAYIADGKKGLTLVDISNPSNPKFIVTVGGAEEIGKNVYEANGVTLSSDGTKAYIACTVGLQIIDISDYKKPTVLGLYNVGGYLPHVIQVALSPDGTIAYLGNDRTLGLYIIDVKNPSKPKLEKIMFYPSLKGFEDEKWYPSGITIAKNKKQMYVVGEFDGVKNSFEIYDITEPKNPKPIGAVEVQAGAIISATSADEKIAYIASAIGGVEYIDISNPTKPLRLGGFNAPQAGREDIAITNDGTKAYVTAINKGIYVVDLTYQNSALIGRLNDPRFATEDIALSKDGNIAYLASGYEGLIIADISNPKEPKVISIFNDNDLQATGIQISEDERFAYISNNDEEGIYIINIEDTYAPFLMGSIKNRHAFSSPSDIAVSNGKAYIADYDEGLKIIDITNPNNPQLINKVEMPQDTIDSVTLSKDGKLAYVANFSNLIIIDIDTLQVISSMNVNSFMTDATLSKDGNTLYVTDFTYGLLIVDVTNPKEPKTIGSVKTPGAGESVKISHDGKTAYVANYRAGLQIIDVSDVKNPKIIGSVALQGIVSRLAISDDDTKAYVVGHGERLQIVDLTRFK